MWSDEWGNSDGGPERLFARARDVLPGREPEPAHARERDCLTTTRAGGRHLRVVTRWRVREPRQRCRLRDAHLGGRSTEVQRTGRADACGPLPELHAVEILL